MEPPRQVKRKLSETVNLDPPSVCEVRSPLSDTGSGDSPRDEDLVSAAEALTRLTNSTSPPPVFHDAYSSTSQISSPIPTTTLKDIPQQIHPIVQRVSTISKLPLVTNAKKYYETSKRNYATFNYAAGIVEKAAMPVFNKIEVNLNNKHQAKLEQKAQIKKRRVQNKGQDKHEIKKRIKFCLHILKLANDNISAKVNELQDKIKESKASPKSNAKKKLASPKSEHQLEYSQNVEFPSNEITPTSTNVPEKALQTNHEIVATVKKIVHVISNFRPSSLNVAEGGNGGPDVFRGDDVKLKKTIREIILRLPKQVSQSVPGAQKAPNQAICFARESLDMIGRLTTVFNEQLEKAEHWVDRSAEKESGEPSSGQSSDSSEVTTTQRPGVVRLKTEESFHSL